MSKPRRTRTARVAGSALFLTLTVLLLSSAAGTGQQAHQEAGKGAAREATLSALWRLPLAFVRNVSATRPGREARGST